MRFCDKLLQLRREKGFSQEQLADLLNVSRQSVSKWEAGGTMPELEKIKALSDLFGVSVDYLVRDNIVEPERTKAGAEASDDAAIMEQLGEIKRYMKKHAVYEYKSKTLLFGVPLVHVKLSKDMGGRPAVAKGIVAIGNIAIGVLSIGGVSVGVLALGGISLGLLLALGGLGIGLLAFGGVAAGMFAFGGIAAGMYAMGGAAVAAELAAGGVAAGKVAIGDAAYGEYTLLTGGTTGSQIKSFILQHYPDMWDVIVRLLSNMGQS